MTIVNAAATFGQVVVAVAGFMLVVAVVRLGAASTERPERNKRKGGGWPLC